jgi:hypothetical protein
VTRQEEIAQLEADMLAYQVDAMRGTDTMSKQQIDMIVSRVSMYISETKKQIGKLKKQIKKAGE